MRFPSVVGPELAGAIDLPEGEIRGWGIFVHGFTLGKDSPAASRVSKQLAREGIGMLRYDNLGIGDSDGDWGDGSFTVKVQDTIRAAALMAERGTPADLLVGHSWGGAAAIAAATEATGVRALATIGAPVEPSHVERQYDAVMDRVLSEGSHEWFVGGRTLVLKRAFVEDVRRAHLRDRIRELNLPLLVLHSPTDQTVDIDNAGEIFREARHPRSFVALEEADHLLTARGQAQRAAHIISAWADQYIHGARRGGRPSR
ncbi:alpha/beta hydrolase family protein [Streptomyces noursei]|uniref:alpha/beta hydrolase family protein n=1 Tax=Streptomyces noursei TaxID=1971 RepID=UPI00034108B4|nr:alpha/beta fold hydrolase [Streptomyces noursei]AKA02093.1 osmotically inducible protein OsmC [Streptomyces noursei ZPM]EOS98214.1 osmotically inducible protein OsmC [Streptomyces noursei CCRC 11814]MCZ0974775.1 alpha/beta fold hydrolase [Streptomyces noursei]UWS70578.1 alpha/beta fold hydrolase [Streptomyces noursei]